MNQEHNFLENVLKEYKNGSSMLASSMIMSKYDTLESAALAFAQMSIIDIINNRIIPYFSDYNLATLQHNVNFSNTLLLVRCYFPTDDSLIYYEELENLYIPFTIQDFPTFINNINITVINKKTKLLEIRSNLPTSWNKAFSESFKESVSTEELTSIIFSSVYPKCIESMYSSDGNLKDDIEDTINNFLTITCDSNYYELEESNLST